MTVLLTNDDGIAAAGLGALETALKRLGYEVVVVAPAVEQSMCGHRITIHSAIKVMTVGSTRFAVSGTPADCVRVALFGLGIRPQLVCSGINHGGNLGQDIHISGTCAAAREAAYHGVPALAFSHYLLRDMEVNWQRMSSWLEELLPSLISEAAETRGAFMNINLPHLPPGDDQCPPIVRTTAARQPLPVVFEKQADLLDPSVSHFQYSARYADRGQDSGSDVEVVFGGKVSVAVTQIHP
jgi:5'-nucleotidase